jgi:hypothetical protein
MKALFSLMQQQNKQEPKKKIQQKIDSEQKQFRCYGESNETYILHYTFQCTRLKNWGNISKDRDTGNISAEQS